MPTKLKPSAVACRAMALPRLLVASLAVAMVLSGCIGAKKENEKPASIQANQTGQLNTTLPDGREFAAAKETNKTENSTVGGVIHKHDYWMGKETIAVYDYDVGVGLTPIFERGDNQHLLEAFINLDGLPEKKDAHALIFEGTGAVVFTITSAPQWATDYRLTFRTAAKDWSNWEPITVGKPFEYKPSKIETDMPHSIRSLWNWKVQANGPAPVTGDPFGLTDASGGTLHVKIEVKKSADVDNWPAHPDFYGGIKERVVAANKQGKTNVQNAADVLVYGVEPDQIVPDKLVSMGTSVLDVYVNITQLTLPPGVPNGGFTLYWRTANTTPDDLGIFNIANETDKQTKAYFHLKLDPNTVDSPYQPTSRFGFKVLANPVDDSKVACYRCMPYTIEYTMTIIARPDATGVQAPLVG